jgi:hypothetical protein
MENIEVYVESAAFIEFKTKLSELLDVETLDSHALLACIEEDMDSAEDALYTVAEVASYVDAQSVNGIQIIAAISEGRARMMVTGFSFGMLVFIILELLIQ